MIWFMMRSGWANTATIAMFALLPVAVALSQGLAL